MASKTLGTVLSLWRYPVKSMMGEELNATEITERGVLGDRAFALVDAETGKVVSAKNPRKWAGMFECRAAYAEEPQPGRLPPVKITLPDGAPLRSDQAGAGETLSRILGRTVKLAAGGVDQPQLEEYWPDIEGLTHRETVTEEPMPPGTFFDLGVVHLLTTATIDRLRQLYPDGRFEVRRFRPNVVVDAGEATGFVENDWVGHNISLGQGVQLRVFSTCPRCVMTTLPQGDLPQDYGILRTAAKHNNADVGVYATVVQPGTVRRGDPVALS